MEKTILSILIALWCFQSALSLKIRIAGGKFGDVKDFPYHASLIYNGSNEEIHNEPICGAAIITDKWLVTAGHCLKDMSNDELKVRTGATKRYNDGEVHDIKQTIIHPGFKENEYVITDDIGLIELTKPILFSDIQKAIPLAQSTYKPTPGDILIISGFGREEKYEDTKTMQLKTASLPIVNLTKCQDDYFLDPVTENHLCAGVNSDSSCNGDSGGPAIMSGRLTGIISTGFICDTTSVPAIFTAVHKYLDWISEYVKTD